MKKIGLISFGIFAMSFLCMCSCATMQPADASDKTEKKIRVALVQFDALPGRPEHNLIQMERLTRKAVAGRAELVMFHEGTLTDYTPKVEQLNKRFSKKARCIMCS